MKTQVFSRILPLAVLLSVTGVAHASADRGNMHQGRILQQQGTFSGHFEIVDDDGDGDLIEESIVVVAENNGESDDTITFQVISGFPTPDFFTIYVDSSNDPTVKLAEIPIIVDNDACRPGEPVTDRAIMGHAESPGVGHPQSPGVGHL